MSSIKHVSIRRTKKSIKKIKTRTTNFHPRWAGRKATPPATKQGLINAQPMFVFTFQGGWDYVVRSLIMVAWFLIKHF